MHLEGVMVSFIFLGRFICSKEDTKLRQDFNSEKSYFIFDKKMVEKSSPLWYYNREVNIRNLVIIAKGSHLFPSRTQKLSPLTLMVLGWRRPGRVRRRQIFLCAYF